jgi:hypothetical protein
MSFFNLEIEEDELQQRVGSWRVGAEGVSVGRLEGCAGVCVRPDGKQWGSTRVRLGCPCVGRRRQRGYPYSMLSCRPYRRCLMTRCELRGLRLMARRLIFSNGTRGCSSPKVPRPGPAVPCLSAPCTPRARPAPTLVLPRKLGRPWPFATPAPRAVLLGTTTGTHPRWPPPWWVPG